MTKLPALTGKEIVSLLKKSGFTIERQTGLLSKILRDVEMTKEDFLKILED